MTTRSAGENQQTSESQEETRSDSQKRRCAENMIFQNRLEYLAILFILQSGNTNFILTATNCTQYKGISFLILYYGIHLIIIAPIQCQHLFLGYYSKFGYMKVWNIFPIGYGIGASMMALSIYTCIHWSSLTGQLVLQSVLILFTPDNYWTDCSYESENLPPCFELSSEDRDVDCNKTYYPGIAQYYRVSNLWRPDQKPDGMGPVNTKWIAASAVVWMIVGILTIRDFKSFKGVFAKLGYSVTTVSFFMMIWQWASLDYADIGTFMILDFTGLFSSEVWIKALTHAILMSHICEGTIIQLGSYGPTNAMPDTDALLVGCLSSALQCVGIFYIYSSYGYMTITYGVEMSCFIRPHEAIIMALTPTQLSLLPMDKLWILIIFLILTIKGIMEMVTFPLMSMRLTRIISHLRFIDLDQTYRGVFLSRNIKYLLNNYPEWSLTLSIYLNTIVFTSTVNSFSEAFPSVKAYRAYLVSVVTLSCFSISLIFTTKVGEIFTHQSFDLVETFVTLLIVALMSSLILFSYSVTRLCDDIQFMHKFEPTLLMKAVFYLTPLIATYYTASHMVIFFSFLDKTNSFYNELWELKPFLIVSCISLVTPLLIVCLFMYGKHVRTRTVGLLFHPTKDWGYPDEEVNESRRHFNPRRELRYMVNKSCAHICLLDNKRMQDEIRKREAIRDSLKRNGFEVMHQEV